MARAVRLGVLAMALVLSFGGAAFAQVKEVKIGVLFPLTGPAASSGAELRAGAELAADIANNGSPGLEIAMAKAKGIKSLGGAKITLIFKDHEGNPALGADLAKKLIQDDKVSMVMGCFHSSVTKAVSAVCEQLGTPMINDSSTSPGLTRQGYKWFWRTTPHDETFTRDLFLFLKGLTEGKAAGAKVAKEDIDAVASACEKTEWGSSVSEQIQRIAPEFGFEVKKSILYADKAADLSSEARSMLAVKPEVLLFASYGSDATLWINTLKSLKAAPKIIWGQNAGFEAPDFPVVLGDAVEGILTRTVFLPKVAEVKKVAGQINGLYKAKTNKDMVGAASRAFTGMQVIYHILEAAGSTEPAALQKAANALDLPGAELVMPWAGVKFATEGEDLGQNIKGMGLIGQYQKDASGKMGLEIVYPFDLASAKLQYPFKGYAN